jgi:GntR family transcriptional repressor for pyruvate dehydrogenase complex
MSQDTSKFRFSPVQTQRASEAIYDQIRDQIINGDISPGDRLPSERNLMEMFNRSRPSIREALRMLESAGLIKTIPGSGGAVVLKLSSKSVEEPLQNMLALNQLSYQELVEYRQLNEIAFAGWAAERRTEQELQDIIDCFEKSKLLKRDFVAFIDYDIVFHEKIVAATHNRLAKIVNKVVHTAVNNILLTEYGSRTEDARLSMCNQVLKMHEDLLKAIADKDVALAKECMSNHINEFVGKLSN